MLVSAWGRGDKIIKELKPSNFLGKWSWEWSAACLFSPCFIIFEAEPQMCSVVGCVWVAGG